jgi:hypothetical protein
MSTNLERRPFYYYVFAPPTQCILVYVLPPEDRRKPNKQGDQMSL